MGTWTATWRRGVLRRVRVKVSRCCLRGVQHFPCGRLLGGLGQGCFSWWRKGTSHVPGSRTGARRGREARVEGTLDVPNHRDGGQIRTDQNDIKTARCRAGIAQTEVGMSGVDDSTLLRLGRHPMPRVEVSAAPGPGLHLVEHDGVSEPRNHVDFCPAPSPVPRQNPVPQGPQKLHGAVFRLAACPGAAFQNHATTFTRVAFGSLETSRPWDAC